LDEVKGHTFLIQAVSELCSEGIPVSLAIIGDGPLRGQLEEQISSSDGGRAIALLGAKKREDVREALLDSDVFALAGVVSQSGAAETQGLVLIEAQAVGLPVVCTRVGGVPDSINDGETGILCEPGNITAIKKAIRFFAEHPDERFRYGKAGRHFVEGKFSVERMLDAFEKLYESFSGEEDGCRKIRGRIMSKLFLVPYKRKKQKGK
jgi:colanic acid/amylovoran biosynthesis glycosyltransferase